MRLTTLTLFVSFNALYYLSFVVGIGMLGFSGKTLYGISPNNSIDVAKMIFNFFQSIIGFAAAYFIFRSAKITKFIQSPYSSVPSKNLAQLYATVALGIFTFLVFKTPLLSLDYSTAFTHRSENSASAFLQTLFYVFSAVSVSLYVSLGKKFSPVCLAMVCSLATVVFLTGDKNALIVGFFALVYSMEVYQKKIKFRRLFTLIFFVLFILFLSSFLRFYRADMDFQTALTLGFYRFDLLSMDGAGPLISIIYAMERPSEYLLGSSYFKDIYNIIPRFIWPDRPLTVPEEFAQIVIRNWQPGMGLGYSPYAEAQNNWGPYFIFLHFFVFGAAWFLAWGSFARMFSVVCKNKDVISRIYYVYGAYLLILSFRSTSLSFIKSMVHFFLALIILHTIYMLLISVKGGFNREVQQGF